MAISPLFYYPGMEHMKSFTISLYHYLSLLLLCFLSFFPLHAFAIDGHVYLSGQGGASRLSLGKNNPNINYYDGLLNDEYLRNSTHSNVTEFGLQGGEEFTFDCFLPKFALGLGVYTNPKLYHFHGNVFETALGDPGSVLYSYQFSTHSTRLMFEGTMLWSMQDDFTVFINAGLGNAWIKMKGYSETAPITGISYPPLPPFQSRTNSRFAYQAGLGLGYEFNFATCPSQFRHERISVGYQYVNLGNASFGIRGIVYPYILNLGHLHNNDVYLAYTHLF